MTPNPSRSLLPRSSSAPKPYYEDEAVTIYHGNALEVYQSVASDVLVSDPPYPNNAGHFDDAVADAYGLLAEWNGPALVFWHELEPPPVDVTLVAVHIWHRANVNGRPYEPIYHVDPDGRKRRSEVYRHAVEFENATGAEYLGHPTQKPVALMQELIRKTQGVVLDPFMGVGSTLRAAKNLGRKAIGIEIDERYCETAARRLSQDVLFGEAA